MLGVICKKVTFFQINCEKCQLKFGLFYVQGQPGLKIKIRDHSQTRFDVTNPMAFLDLANKLLFEKIIFFKVSTIFLICVSFQ